MKEEMKVKITNYLHTGYSQSYKILFREKSIATNAYINN